MSAIILELSFCNRRKMKPHAFLRVEEVNATHPLSKGCIYLFN